MGRASRSGDCHIGCTDGGMQVKVDAVQSARHASDHGRGVRLPDAGGLDVDADLGIEPVVVTAAQLEVIGEIEVAVSPVVGDPYARPLTAGAQAEAGPEPAVAHVVRVVGDDQLRVSADHVGAQRR